MTDLLIIIFDDLGIMILYGMELSCLYISQGQ